MNILCWNCRGVGNPWSVRQLRRWNTFYAPDIMFLSETMINKTGVEALKSRSGFVVFQDAVKQVVCVFYGGRKSPSLLFLIHNTIYVEILMMEIKKRRFVGIHGWTKEDEKHHTWSLMHHLCEDSNRPILIGGDFNEILSYEEK